jgi:4-hydroxy-3-polyprenylbenzoate decarboxylase
VAVALSAEPVLPYCATAPMPEGLDELLLAGFLARKRIEMVKCVSVDLEVPASSHIVLEGYVDPGERRREGPFGDHTGLYSQPDDFPVFHLTCVTRRKTPTYLTTVVGIPPMEDAYLGLASERIFLPMIKRFPEIIDMHFPAEGIFHAWCWRRSTSVIRSRGCHERLLGPRSADVFQSDRRGRQGRRRPRSQPGRVDRRATHRSVATSR